MLRQEYHQKHGRLDIAKLSGVIAFDSATGVVRVAWRSSKHVEVTSYMLDTWQGAVLIVNCGGNLAPSDTD